MHTIVVVALPISQEWVEVWTGFLHVGRHSKKYQICSVNLIGCSHAKHAHPDMAKLKQNVIICVGLWSWFFACSKAFIEIRQVLNGLLIGRLFFKLAFLKWNISVGLLFSKNKRNIRPCVLSRLKTELSLVRHIKTSKSKPNPCFWIERITLLAVICYI